MNKNKINKILLIYILFIPLISFNKGNKEKRRKDGGYSNFNQQQGPTNKQITNQYTQKQPSQQINQPIAYQQNIPLNQQIQSPQINNQQTIPVQAKPLYSYNTNTTYDMTNNIETKNGNSLTIVQTLDPKKAAILIAEIYALKQNYEILLEATRHSIVNNFTSVGIDNNHKLRINQKPIRYNYRTRLNDNTFNPKTQIISPNGGYFQAPAPAEIAINPYTGLPVTFQDLVILKELRRLYLNEVMNLLFILSDIEATKFNVQQIYQFAPQKVTSLKTPSTESGYNFNLIRPLWRMPISYITSAHTKTSLNIK